MLAGTWTTTPRRGLEVEWGDNERDKTENSPLGIKVLGNARDLAMEHRFTPSSARPPRSLRFLLSGNLAFSNLCLIAWDALRSNSSSPSMMQVLTHSVALSWFVPCFTNIITWNSRISYWSFFCEVRRITRVIFKHSSDIFYDKSMWKTDDNWILRILLHQMIGRLFLNALHVYLD